MIDRIVCSDAVIRIAYAIYVLKHKLGFSTSAKTEKMPKRLSDVMDSFLRRYFVLAASAANLSFFWLWMRSSMDTEAQMLIAGIAIGLAIATFLFYRRDWRDVLELEAFHDRFKVEVFSELQLRRKVAGKVYRGCVYVIQDVDVTGYYKIGKTTHPADRIGHFDVMLPFQTRVVHIVASKDCSALEAMLHRHFAAKRKRGEWFELSDDDIAWLIALKAV